MNRLEDLFDDLEKQLSADIESVISKGGSTASTSRVGSSIGFPKNFVGMNSMNKYGLQSFSKTEKRRRQSNIELLVLKGLPFWMHLFHARRTDQMATVTAYAGRSLDPFVLANFLRSSRPRLPQSR